MMVPQCSTRGVRPRRRRRYKAGVSLLKGAPERAAEAAQTVYETLASLDAELATRRFLLGTPEPTAVDVRLTMTLLRYDVAYRHAFALRGGRGAAVLPR